MKKLVRSFMLCFLLVTLPGCAEKKIIENLGLNTLIGYDKGEEDTLTTTAVILHVNPEFQSTVDVITNENQKNIGSFVATNRQTSKKVVSGQMRSILYGEELAKEGIRHHIQTLSKNPNISNSLIMAVVEGDAKSLLDYRYQNIEDISQHIFRLFEQNNELEQVISSTLYEVAHDYYSSGRDIVMPIIKRKEEFIEITGVALFNNAKMVGTLPAKESFYVKVGRDRYDSGTFEITIEGDAIPSSIIQNSPKEISLVLDTMHSRKKIKLMNPSIPEFDLQINMKARLFEISENINLGEQKNVTAIEKALNKKLTSELSRVIAYTQEINSDVFGFGEYYRSSVRNSHLTREKWKDIYREAIVNVKFDLTITRDGVFD